SMEEPLVFLGEYVDFKELHFTGLRRFDEETAASKGRAKAFRCPKCGGALNIRGLFQTVSMACPSCGNIIDISNEDFQLLQTVASRLNVTPLIPLGTKGTFRGDEFEVIGFLRRNIKVEGVAYRWSEYLLFNPYIGFRWLTEYNGHWNFVEQ